MGMRVVLCVTHARPFATRALAPRRQAVGARRLDGRLVRTVVIRWHRSCDEDRTGRGKE
jgi:hypothetical protein